MDMSKRSNMGRPSLFRDKRGGSRIQGVITKIGAERFELHRARLATIAKRDQKLISDADVIEYLARGEVATRDYLARAI